MKKMDTEYLIVLNTPVTHHGTPLIAKQHTSAAIIRGYPLIICTQLPMVRWIGERERLHLWMVFRDMVNGYR